MSSFKISYNGEVLPETDQDTVKANLKNLLKDNVDPAVVDSFFDGQSVTIKNSANRLTAAKYRRAFLEAGAILTLTELTDNESGGEQDMSSEPVKQHYADGEDGEEIIVTNIETVPGMRVVEHFGLVSGSTIRAKHVGRDIMASLKNIVGGELKGYTQLLSESRSQATQRMVKQATELGANAIVNVRFSTSSVAQGAAELYAYGTAVRVE
jgi:uncharacterized protein YbjQ (UPF0145 family)